MDPVMVWPASLHTLKKLKPAASGTRFPAHWAPLVLHQLQHKEDEYRAANPSWMDQDDVPDDIRKEWQGGGLQR